MIVRATSLDVGRRAFSSPSIEYWAPKTDRKNCPAYVHRRAERQEGQKDLVIPAKVLSINIGRSPCIVQYRAMMLHHAGAAWPPCHWCNDAGGFVRVMLAPARSFSADILVACLDKLCPNTPIEIVANRGLADPQIGIGPMMILASEELITRRQADFFRQFCVGRESP